MKLTAIKNKNIFLSLFFLLCISCAAVGVTKVHNYDSKPKNCSLDVYTSQAEIKRQYEVACLIDSRTGSTLFHSRTGSAAIEQARPEACGCGADAIVVESAGSKGVDYSSWGEGTAVIKAIKYR